MNAVVVREVKMIDMKSGLPREHLGIKTTLFIINLSDVRNGRLIVEIEEESGFLLEKEIVNV